MTRDLNTIDLAGDVINVYKPVDWTSFDVVKKVKNILRVKKAGHAGTLDPFAEGVLVLGIGKGTKKLGGLTGLEKEYEAVVELGKQTDTFDRTGTVTESTEVPPVPVNDLTVALEKFSGEIEQVPPMYSAKKVNGRRLYKLARKGVEVERKPVSVTVYSIRLIEYLHPLLRIYIKCSKGTYIRSIAHDFGQALGCGAYLTELKRLSVGEYRIEDSVTLSELERHFISGIN